MSGRAGGLRAGTGDGDKPLPRRSSWGICRGLPEESKSAVSLGSEVAGHPVRPTTASRELPAPVWGGWGGLGRTEFKSPLWEPQFAHDRRGAAPHSETGHAPSPQPGAQQRLLMPSLAPWWQCLHWATTRGLPARPVDPKAGAGSIREAAVSLSVGSVPGRGRISTALSLPRGGDPQAWRMRSLWPSAGRLWVWVGACAPGAFSTCSLSTCARGRALRPGVLSGSHCPPRGPPLGLRFSPVRQTGQGQQLTFGEEGGTQPRPDLPAMSLHQTTGHLPCRGSRHTPSLPRPPVAR